MTEQETARDERDPSRGQVEQAPRPRNEVASGATKPLEQERPLLRVVTADATPEEVAALVAVLAALGSSGGEAPRRPRPEWSAPRRLVRSTLPHGPGGWRASTLPR